MIKFPAQKIQFRTTDHPSATPILGIPPFMETTICINIIYIYIYYILYIIYYILYIIYYILYIIYYILYIFILYIYILYYIILYIYIFILYIYILYIYGRKQMTAYLSIGFCKSTHLAI